MHILIIAMQLHSCKTVITKLLICNAKYASKKSCGGLTKCINRLVTLVVLRKSTTIWD